MRALAVLPVIFTGTEAIRRLVPETADAGFPVSDGQLVQRIQQVRARHVAIDVVAPACRFECVVDDLRRRIAIKGQQAGALVFDGDIDRVRQRTCRGRSVAAFHQPGDFRNPVG